MKKDLFAKKLPILKSIIIVAGIFILNRLAVRLLPDFISAQYIVTILSLLYGYLVYWLLKQRGATKGVGLTVGITVYLIGQASLFIVVEIIIFVLLSFYPFKEK